MQLLKNVPDDHSDTIDVAVLRRTMERLLTTLLGIAPRQITAVSAQNMILVRAFHPFSEAEAKMVSSGAHDSLCQQYYDGLFSVSDRKLKAELSRVLGCDIQSIHHVLNPDAGELDIIICLNHSSANISHYTEE